MWISVRLPQPEGLADSPSPSLPSYHPQTSLEAALGGWQVSWPRVTTGWKVAGELPRDEPEEEPEGDALRKGTLLPTPH